MPDQGGINVLEKDAPNNGHKVAQGIAQGDGLQPVGHVLNGRGKT